MAVPLTSAACRDVAGPETEWHPDPVVVRQSTDMSDQERLDLIASAVAKGASVRSVRQRLAAASRQSAAPEGKVFFRDLIAADGQVAAGFQAKLSGVAMETLLQGLPPLDFYIARASDRRTWDGAGPRVAVIAVLDPDQGIGTAYFSDGTSEVTTDPNAIIADALIAIHPTERAQHTQLASMLTPSIGSQIYGTDDKSTSPLPQEAVPLRDGFRVNAACEEGSETCGGGGEVATPSPESRTSKSTLETGSARLRSSFAPTPIAGRISWRRVFSGRTTLRCMSGTQAAL